MQAAGSTWTQYPPICTGAPWENRQRHQGDGGTLQCMMEGVQHWLVSEQQHIEDLSSLTFHLTQCRVYRIQHCNHVLVHSCKIKCLTSIMTNSVIITRLTLGRLPTETRSTTWQLTTLWSTHVWEQFEERKAWVHHCTLKSNTIKHPNASKHIGLLLLPDTPSVLLSVASLCANHQICTSVYVFSATIKKKQKKKSTPLSWRFKHLWTCPYCSCGSVNSEALVVMILCLRLHNSTSGIPPLTSAMG